MADWIRQASRTREETHQCPKALSPEEELVELFTHCKGAVEGRSDRETPYQTFKYIEHSRTDVPPEYKAKYPREAEKIHACWQVIFEVNNSQRVKAVISENGVDNTVECLWTDEAGCVPAWVDLINEVKMEDLVGMFGKPGMQ